MKNITLEESISRVVRSVELGDKDVELSSNYAAVVVVLSPYSSGGVGCLFVRRRSSERDPWSGQVAFPGGRWSNGDSSLLDTAARELWEETGLVVDRDVKVLGYLEDVSPRNAPDLKVRPYVAILKNPQADVRKGEEIDDVMWISLNKLRRRIVRVYAKRLGREFTILGYVLEPDTVIWGLTARVLTWVIDALEPLMLFNKR